jgi:hypothetical protein
MGKLYNLARMTTATTGTGTITLGSAVSGFLTFAQAGVANGDVVSYGIEDGANREVGTGTYTSSGTTLSRSVVKSTNSNTAINLSGSAQVFITPLASDMLVGYGTVASGSAIAITGSGTYLLTGTTSVNTMTGGSTGMVVTLTASGQSAGVPVVLNHATSTNNLSLRDSANLGIYAGESVSFVFDGTKWVEIDRNLKTVLAYAEITTTVSPTATTEATANAAITLSAVTMDGATPVIVTFHAERVLQGTSWITPVLYDGTSIGRWTKQGQITSSRGLHLTRRLTPTAASHTYSTRFYVDAGTGSIEVGAGGSGNDMPAYMSLTRDL